jgi:hypothetical protein
MDKTSQLINEVKKLSHKITFGTRVSIAFSVSSRRKAEVSENPLAKCGYTWSKFYMTQTWNDLNNSKLTMSCHWDTSLSLYTCSSTT